MKPTNTVKTIPGAFNCVLNHIKTEIKSILEHRTSTEFKLSLLIKFIFNSIASTFFFLMEF